MTDERQDTTADWVERSNGRREGDRYKCAMHDYLMNKNDHCFDIIKQTIKDEVTKRDHKFEVLESRLENFISKWAVGMILLICTSIVGAFFGLSMRQFENMHNEIYVVSEAINKISQSLAVMSRNQTGILKELEELSPEHKKLMDHLQDDKRHK